MLLTLLLLAATAAATNLLLPLYNRPGPAASQWSGVLTALSSTPRLPATVIINVDHGPGTVFDPNGTTLWRQADDWRAGTKALGALPHVSVVGYVHISRCQRNIEQVKADINTWARWRDAHGIAISGIFVDEAPNDGTACPCYLASVNRHIRQVARLNTVVWNPGFPAHPGSLQPYYDLLEPTLVTALETCWTQTSNGEDLCDGAYTVYDAAGYGTTVDATLRDWVGEENYPNTAILIHGFHGSNGLYEADSESLLGAIQAVVARDIGAAAFTTNHWITPDAAPADIVTFATVLDEAHDLRPM
jgi:hypothetical protein